MALEDLDHTGASRILVQTIVEANDQENFRSLEKQFPLLRQEVTNVLTLNSLLQFARDRLLAHLQRSVLV